MITNSSGFSFSDAPLNTNATFGKTMMVVDQAPYYDYVDGKRNADPSGTRYTVVLPEKKFKRIGVKVEGGTPLDDAVIEKTPRVVFNNLVAKFYSINDVVGLTIKADSIKVVQS